MYGFWKEHHFLTKIAILGIPRFRTVTPDEHPGFLVKIAGLKYVKLDVNSPHKAVIS